MTGNVSTGKSAFHNDGMILNEMPSGMTIGQALGSRTARNIIADAHAEDMRKRVLGIDEIEMAYAASDSPASSILLTAIRRLRGGNGGKKIFYFDLADSTSNETFEMTEAS